MSGSHHQPSTLHHTSPAPLAHPAPSPVHHPAPSPLPNNTNIPTYEIITSCQPRVMYSNGYYFTTFSNQTNQPTNYNNPTNYTAQPSQNSCSTYTTSPPQQSYAYSSPANNSNSTVTTAPCFTCSCQCQGSLQWSISPNQTT